MDKYRERYLLSLYRNLSKEAQAKMLAMSLQKSQKQDKAPQIIISIANDNSPTQAINGI